MLFVVLALALVVGVVLGLLGGGGSILTVPLLTSVAGMAPRAAIASSLLLVAVTSAAGAVVHARAGRVRWRVALVVGAGGMVGAFAGGRLAGLLPARALMILFSIVMAAAAAAMLRRRGEPRVRRDLGAAVALAVGAAIGLVAGMVGAGGGFLIVPALVVVGGLRTDDAIGTSLVVIAMQSGAGLAGHLGHAAIDLPSMLAITGVAVIGGLLGGRLAGRVAPAALRRGFGILVAVIAVWTFAQQLA